MKEFDVLLLHGDMEQAERNKVITSFRKQDVPIMVATDVAGKKLLFQNESKFGFIFIQLTKYIKYILYNLQPEV